MPRRQEACDGPEGLPVRARHDVDVQQDFLFEIGMRPGIRAQRREIARQRGLCQRRAVITSAGGSRQAQTVLAVRNNQWEIVRIYLVRGKYPSVVVR